MEHQKLTPEEKAKALKMLSVWAKTHKDKMKQQEEWSKPHVFDQQKGWIRK